LRLETCLGGIAELPLPLLGFPESFNKSYWFVAHCCTTWAVCHMRLSWLASGPRLLPWEGFRAFGQCWAHAARGLLDVATRSTTSWTMPPFHQQWCLQTYRLGSQCLSLIGTGARSQKSPAGEEVKYDNCVQVNFDITFRLITANFYDNLINSSGECCWCDPGGQFLGDALFHQKSCQEK